MDQIEPIAAYIPYMTCPGNHESGESVKNILIFIFYVKPQKSHVQTKGFIYSFILPVIFLIIKTALPCLETHSPCTTVST